MADTVTLQGYLAEAEAALHALMTGQKEVSVGYDGKTVTYTKASEAGLRAYIADLRRQLGTGGRAAAIGMVF